MSRKKKTTNKVAWSKPPETAATQALATQAQTPVDYSTPIRSGFAQAQQRADRTYDNPLGAHTTADVRGKQKREDADNRGQNLGIALANAAQQSSRDKFGRTAGWAGATAPRMYNAQSTQKQPFSWSDGLGIGGSIASGGKR